MLREKMTGLESLRPMMPPVMALPGGVGPIGNPNQFFQAMFPPGEQGGSMAAFHSQFPGLGRGDFMRSQFAPTDDMNWRQVFRQQYPRLKQAMLQPPIGIGVE